MKYAENLFARRDPPARPMRDPAAPPAQATTHPSVHPTTSAPAAAAVRPAAPAPSLDPITTRTEEPGGSKLIVGPNIKLKGVEIDDCDTLVVEGRVEATMVSRAIQIAENGAFIGKVDVDVAEIRGDFKGEMTARKKLVIHASGRVSGKIRYGKMLVQEGGEMSGDIGALAANE
ncbi:MAG TPA: polymer-forming cytoskeletal protein [Usitatibacter sp.]